MEQEKTIFALATPLGGAIAIIRISGKDSKAILEDIFTGRISDSCLKYGKIVDTEGTVLDESMAVFFQSPKSYTGEDMAELHIHSSKAVAQSIMDLLIKKGATPAHAGEFTKRAFLNGKMALSQAEAVMDLINSTAKRSASAAILQLSGVLSHRITEIENSLTDTLSLINAQIDYPDEMEGEEENTSSSIRAAIGDIDKLLSEGMRCHKIRDGFTIALVGKPNVGKSSLLNALISQNRAIVTEVAGTTRDIIDADSEFCGLPVHLFDTAGLHHTDDMVEQLGIERTKEVMDCADLLYVLMDCSQPLRDSDIDLLSQTADKQRIIVFTKCDKPMVAELPEGITCKAVYTSTKTEMGIDELKAITAEIISPGESAGIITNMRHIKALSQAKESLCDALLTDELDCIATDVEQALRHISLITGNAVDEIVLDKIFERFCVGK